MSAYGSDFDETKYKPFIKNDEMLAKYKEISIKVSNRI